jgi:hypothetical protein
VFEPFSENEGNDLEAPDSSTAGPHARTVGAARLRADVLTLWLRGMVPIAIANRLGVSVDTVAKVLRGHGLDVPAYTTVSGPKRSPAPLPTLRSAEYYGRSSLVLERGNGTFTNQPPPSAAFLAVPASDRDVRCPRPRWR